MLLVSSSQGGALLVLPADGRLSWKKVRAILPGGKKAEWRLAKEDEVDSITGGCVPGSVPPFGSCFVGTPVPTWVDKGMQEIDIINFNCGLRTRSIRLPSSEFLRCEEPQVADLSE
eukprot:TRINITY_DN22452_c0_g1_i3.p1 TRINITY_DN22452_c0_g1~~TRINITY_DN22452_c0_g1_i3.p1  ORF type:complete len:116 (-),score=21.64 TRINITY_DN22452_c0_g1_i3:60-407(-)